MEYKIIYHTNIDKFQSAVNQALKEGWKLSGGATSWFGSLCQPVVRKSQPNPANQ